MSRRIDIELTSARPDGSWTWRAAGAREPKGVVDGSLLPSGARMGSVFKADAEVELDGITILSVSDPKSKSTSKSGVIELIPNDTPFEGVTQQLARRERGDRGDRGDRRERGPRGDRPGGDRPRGDRPSGPRPGGDRPGGADRRPREGGPDADRRGPRPQRRERPSFTPPPELPQRPKAKRLKPGRTRRNAVLAELPEEQRPVAERALQGGLPAVRQAVNEQNARNKAEGKPEIPASGLLSMAEQLLPRLRVAEWLDRADAALADLEELDLRDLRSVVASADDPMVARDETTRELTATLKQALVDKQEKELQLWYEDIEAAIGVGRVIRALKLSSQPPKAGIRFPTELARRLADAATASLTPDALSDRWSALLEAAAFSPVRSLVTPAARPEQPSEDLTATVRRLAPLLPQIAGLFGVEVAPGTPSPKPLRPTRPTGPAKKASGPTAKAPTAPRPAPPTPAEVAAVQAGAAVEASTPEPVEAAAPEPVEAGTGEEPAVEPVEPEAPTSTEGSEQTDAGGPDAAEAVEIIAPGSSDVPQLEDVRQAEEAAGAPAEPEPQLSAEPEPEPEPSAEFEPSAEPAPQTVAEAIESEPAPTPEA